MKRFFNHPAIWFLNFSFLLFNLSAATNDLSGVLQRGLFEEEANRNLDAAAQAYQTVSAQFDKDRKLAATAIFRLGEIYRKQGRTNDAVTQYERIIRNFSEEQTLVTLSRQNLTGLQTRRPTPSPPLMPIEELRSQLEQERMTVAAMDALPKTNRTAALAALFANNDTIEAFTKQRDSITKQLEVLRQQFSEESEPVKTARDQLQKHQTQIDEYVKKLETGFRTGLEITEKALKQRETSEGNSSNNRMSSANVSRNDSSSSDAAILKKLKNLSRDEVRQILPTLMPDQLLTELLAQYQTTEATRAEKSADFAPQHPEVIKLNARLKILDQQIENRITGIIKALELRVAATPVPTENADANNVSPDVTTDFEENEIRRIQAMVQNSPDLINGSGGGESPLMSAASRGWLRVATFLLDNGANINVNAGGQTALHRAVQFGGKAMVELLLQRGADVNAKDGSGGTALHLAASSGFLSIAEVLLKNKANLNARNSTSNSEKSPLHLAAQNGHATLVGFLLANGDDPNRTDAGGQTPLHEAAGRGHAALVERLLKSGATVNLKDKAGETPLMEAAQAGDAATIKTLLAAKADLDAQDIKGRTPLSYAVERGSPDVVKAILDAKADPNAGQLDLPLALAVRGKQIELAEALLRTGADANLAGKTTKVARIPSGMLSDLVRQGPYGPYTPLQIAVSLKDPNMVRLLLKYKGDPNAKDSWSTPPSPLTRWIINDLELRKAFLDAGADANAETESGWPLLVFVTVDGNAAAVESLLEHGAKPDVLSRENRSPLSYATERNNLKCVALLLAAKADPNAISNGTSALHYAMNLGSKEMVELLLAHGADINVKAKEGETPLHWAMRINTTGVGSVKMAELLLSKGADPNVRNESGQTPLDMAKSGQFSVSGWIPSPAAQSLSDQPLVALLRQHGALDNLPRLDRIEARRPEIGFSKTIFFKGTNDWNRFTVLDVLFETYFGGSLAQPQAYANGKMTSFADRIRSGSSLNNPPFPDLHRIVIVRAKGKGIEPARRITVDFILPTGGVDCGRDVPLEFGDTVEISEREHNLQEAPMGFTPEELQQIARCREGTVGLLVRGKRTELKVWPSTYQAVIWSVLERQEARTALFSSSDLSRLKMTRHDTFSSKQREWIVDCSGGKKPDLWLRDGDIIEVPDKP